MRKKKIVGRSLIPLKKENYEAEPFAVCDIEAPGWINFHSIGFFDGTEHRYFLRLQDFFNFLARTKPARVIYAHYSGGFDSLHLLNHCIGCSTWRPVEIFSRGSSMLCLTLGLVGDDYKIEIRDSAAMLPFRLELLADTFQTKHRKLKMRFSFDELAAMTPAELQAVTPEILHYLEHDCRALYEVISHYFEYPMIKKAGPASTVAGQAMRILRQHVQHKDDCVCGKCPPPFHVLSVGNKIDKFVRESYIAGRTEIFRPVWPPPGRAGEALRCYDVTSLFPYCMAQDVPGNFRYWTREYEPTEFAFYNAKVHVPPDTYIPILGQKRETKDGQTKLVFPTGTFRGRWTTLELEYAKTQGVEILEIGQGAVFQNLGPVYKPFVDYVFDLKQRSADDSVDYMVAKLILNSSYGRFGIRRDRSRIVFDKGQEGYRGIAELTKNGKTYAIGEVPAEYEGFSNVATAAWITARARVHMHKLFRSIDFDVWYTDTDSIFTPREMPTGDALGDLKLVEHKFPTHKVPALYDEAVFLLPKTYITKAADKTFVKMKGVDKKAAAAFSVQDYHAALEGERKLVVQVPPRFARLKEGLRRMKKICVMLPGGQKEIRAVYSKRILYENADGWNSRPIQLKPKGKNSEHTNRNTNIQDKGRSKLPVSESDHPVPRGKRKNRPGDHRPLA